MEDSLPRDATEQIVFHRKQLKLSQRTDMYARGRFVRGRFSCERLVKYAHANDVDANMARNDACLISHLILIESLAIENWYENASEA